MPTDRRNNLVTLVAGEGQFSPGQRWWEHPVYLEHCKRFPNTDNYYGWRSKDVELPPIQFYPIDSRVVCWPPPPLPSQIFPNPSILECHAYSEAEYKFDPVTGELVGIHFPPPKVPLTVQYGFSIDNPPLFLYPQPQAYDMWGSEMMKYNRQWEESEGFDVDRVDNVEGIFGLVQPMGYLFEYLDDLSKEALKWFEQKNGSHYKFSKVLKANQGGCGDDYYITFQAKDASDRPVDFQARVRKSLPIPGEPQFVEVQFCRIKPEVKAVKKRPLEASGNDSMSGTWKPKKRQREASGNDSTSGTCSSDGQGGGSDASRNPAYDALIYASSAKAFPVI